jgi:hypothetical protein
MEPFLSLNKISAIKPGATVLAQVEDDGTKRPALAVQRFGNGRVGALMIADLWRWGFRSSESRPDMEKAWRQIVRWSIADVPKRVTLELTASGDGAVRATARVRDHSYEPMTNARVTISMRGAMEDPDRAQQRQSHLGRGIRCGRDLRRDPPSGGVRTLQVLFRNR